MKYQYKNPISKKCDTELKTTSVFIGWDTWNEVCLVNFTDIYDKPAFYCLPADHDFDFY